MREEQLSLLTELHKKRALTTSRFQTEIINFKEFGKTTGFLEFSGHTGIPVYVNEFWTSRQRAAHPLHEISYRACFKPQLPRFFISRLTERKDVVYDPFMGRGTTLLEAALLGRTPAGCDINPLSRIMIEPRLDPPEIGDIEEGLRQINLERNVDMWEELLAFFHPSTLLAISNLREYLLKKEVAGKLDRIDAWIRMVATNRLTGHSRGFFSVYTLPPNQAVSIASQQKINRARKQTPPPRDVKAVILHKSKSLLNGINPRDLMELQGALDQTLIITGSCDHTPGIKEDSVKLVVTSPPFLDNVNYRKDNWLRCWFNGIDAEKVQIWQLRKPGEWQDRMTAVFKELGRILAPGGHVAFEVGEVRKGKVLLETLVVPSALEAGLNLVAVMLNRQDFTKTSQCWGVDNLEKGTNTNRIVLLKKEN